MLQAVVRGTVDGLNLAGYGFTPLHYATNGHNLCFRLTATQRGARSESDNDWHNHWHNDALPIGSRSNEDCKRFWFDCPNLA